MASPILRGVKTRFLDAMEDDDVGEKRPSGRKNGGRGDAWLLPQDGGRNLSTGRTTERLERGGGREASWKKA